MNSQRSAELLFNYGLALYKDSKFDLAIKTFEKVSHQLKGNPKLWFYLGLSVLNYNKECEFKANQFERFNEVQAQKADFTDLSQNCFQKTNGQGSLRRIQLAPEGDRLTKLHKLIAENEQSYLDQLKLTQSELTKNRHKQVNGNLSKA